MKWFLYNLIFSIVYILMMPKFLLRMFRRGGYANRFMDRFGFYPPDIMAQLCDNTARIWIHAVSVGEVSVAGQLMDEMRRQRPGTAFVLSVTSSTGWTQAHRILRSSDILIHNPLDYPSCVRRALNTIRPRAYIITETELWPNIIRQTNQRGCPIFLINARISDRSAPGYRRLKCWFGPVLNCLQKIYAQSILDAQRLKDAGCSANRICVTGSMKFDVAHRNPKKEIELRNYLTQAGFTLEAPILLGGSTWPGEDTFLLHIYQKALTRVPNLRLIIAPRHFEKANEVETAIRTAGFPCLRKTKNATPTPYPENTVLLADTTGELMGFYGLAQTVFVGKSLCEHGAQNMIEPCLCGCAVVVGPHTENFRPVMRDLLAFQAIEQGRDFAETEQLLLDLLTSPKQRQELGQRAKKAVAHRRGITPKIAAEILQITNRN